MDNKTIFTETYKVRSTQVNLNNQLGLYGVLGMLQDIAAEHASYLGFGYRQLIQKGFFWALVQQKLKMTRWPEWNEQITVHTWSLPIQGVYAFREFELYCKGEKIGESASTWITMDIKSRRPIELTDQQEIFFPRTEGGLSFRTERITLPNAVSKRVSCACQRFRYELARKQCEIHPVGTRYDDRAQSP